MDVLLPLGSIIKIKNDKSRYMVIGKRIKDDTQQFDYLCIEYPYGMYIGAVYKYINEEDVDVVSFLGNINK